jgi:hypothetical protein
MTQEPEYWTPETVSGSITIDRHYEDGRWGLNLRWNFLELTGDAISYATREKPAGNDGKSRSRGGPTPTATA